MSTKVDLKYFIDAKQEKSLKVPVKLIIRVHVLLSEFLILDKEEQQCRQMMAGLDKVVSDLDKQEKAIYTQVRPPLEQNRPVQDSADRLQDLRVIIFPSHLCWF